MRITLIRYEEINQLRIKIKKNKKTREIPIEQIKPTLQNVLFIKELPKALSIRVVCVYIHIYIIEFYVQ